MNPERNKYPLHIERSIVDSYRQAFKALTNGLEDAIFEQLEKDTLLQTRDVMRQDSFFNLFGIIKNYFSKVDNVVSPLTNILRDKFKVLDNWTLDKIEDSMNDRTKLLNLVRPKQWALVNGEWKQIYKPLEKFTIVENGIVKTKYNTEGLAISPTKFRNPIVAKQLEETIAQKARESANLIKDITDKQADRLQDKIRKAYLDGKTTEQIKDVVRNTLKVSENRVALIGRDQTQKVANTINRERQQRLGIKEFTWRTMGDGKVRDSHEDLEGEVFDWEKGALGKLDMPDSQFPGDDPNCRCYPEPGNANILEGNEEETNLIKSKIKRMKR